ILAAASTPPSTDEWLRASAARTSQPIVAYEAMASQNQQSSSKCSPSAIMQCLPSPAWATLLLAMKVTMPPASIRASITEAKILRILPSYGCEADAAFCRLRLEIGSAVVDL